MIELYKVDKDFEYWWLNYIYDKDLNIWITFMFMMCFFSSADCEPPIEDQLLGLILLILNI